MCALVLGPASIRLLEHLRSALSPSLTLDALASHSLSIVFHVVAFVSFPRTSSPRLIEASLHVDVNTHKGQPHFKRNQGRSTNMHKQNGQTERLLLLPQGQVHCRPSLKGSGFSRRYLSRSSFCSSSDRSASIGPRPRSAHGRLRGLGCLGDLLNTRQLLVRHVCQAGAVTAMIAQQEDASKLSNNRGCHEHLAQHNALRKAFERTTLFFRPLRILTSPGWHRKP